MSVASCLHSSFLQAINAVMLWPVHGQKVPQASEHLCPVKSSYRLRKPQKLSSFSVSFRHPFCLTFYFFPKFWSTPVCPPHYTLWFVHVQKVSQASEHLCLCQEHLQGSGNHRSCLFSACLFITPLLFDILPFSKVVFDSCLSPTLHTHDVVFAISSAYPIDLDVQLADSISQSSAVRKQKIKKRWVNREGGGGGGLFQIKPPNSTENAARRGKPRRFRAETDGQRPEMTRSVPT